MNGWLELIILALLSSLAMGRRHQEEAMPLHLSIVRIFGFLALACIGGGIYAIYRGANSDTKLDILGAHLSTGSVGVAFVGIGLIIAFFTVRSVLRNQRDLAALPPDDYYRKPAKKPRSRSATR
jgi:hypothetical protein